MTFCARRFVVALAILSAVCAHAQDSPQAADGGAEASGVTACDELRSFGVPIDMCDTADETVPLTSTELNSSPFELVTASGADACAALEELNSAKGVAAVIGDAADVRRLGVLASENGRRVDRRDTAAILRQAATLRHPQSLYTHNKSTEATFAELRTRDPIYDERIRAFEEAVGVSLADPAPPIGAWPDDAPTTPGSHNVAEAGELCALSLTVARAGRTGDPKKTVYIGVFATDDWTEIPARLAYGDWNANPPAEHHVAALRAWRDRFGARLIGVNADTLNVIVEKTPQNKDDALALAHEQYAYAPDIVDQGVGSISHLAAGLMQTRSWYFWWD
ncbi:MAG: DUF4253 domain-containing protein [Parvularculaceae bacterium]